METCFRPVRASQIFAMSVWRYGPPYDMYNLSYPPSAEDVAYWRNPAYDAHAIHNADGLLIAFCTFGVDGQVPGGDYSTEALDIGMGVRPDLTGQGQGAHLAKAVCTFARQTFQPQALRVTIASKNARAIRVWTKNGFRPIQQFVAAKTDLAFDIFVC